MDEKYKVSAKKYNIVSSVRSFLDRNEIISNLMAKLKIKMSSLKTRWLITTTSLFI